MTDEKKLHQILSSLWKNDDSVGKIYYNQALQDVQIAINLQEEPASEDLENAARIYCIDARKGYPRVMDETDRYIYNAFKAGAERQFERVKEALLSEVLPCFMRGGEADEVVAKLEEVLNQKK